MVVKTRSTCASCKMTPEQIKKRREEEKAREREEANNIKTRKRRGGGIKETRVLSGDWGTRIAYNNDRV